MIEVLRAQVPPRVTEDPVMHAIYTAQAQELRQLYIALTEVLEQPFIESATTTGLSRLEHTMAVHPVDFADLPRRRAMLIGKLRGVGTMTVDAIREIISAFGYGTVQVDEYARENRIEITYIDRLGLPPNLEDVEAEVISKLPAHLAVEFIIRYLVWDTLESFQVSWDALDGLGLTWDQLEVWEGL